MEVVVKERKKERFVGWLGGIVSKANQGQQDKLECAKTEMNVRAVQKNKIFAPFHTVVRYLRQAPKAVVVLPTRQL